MPRNFPNGVRVGNKLVLGQDGRVRVKASEIENDSVVDGATVADVLEAARAATQAAEAALAAANIEVAALQARVGTLEEAVDELEGRGQ